MQNIKIIFLFKYIINCIVFQDGLKIIITTIGKK